MKSLFLSLISILVFVYTTHAQLWHYESLGLNSSLSYLDMSAMDEAPNGDVMCNTIELLLKHNGTWSVLPNPYGFNLGNIAVSRAYFDNQSRLWVHTILADTVYYYDSGIWNAISEANQMVEDIAKDPAGNIWGFGFGFAKCLSDTSIPVINLGAGGGDIHMFAGNYIFINQNVYDLSGSLIGSVPVDFGYMPVRPTADGRLVVHDDNSSTGSATFYIVDGISIDTVSIPHTNNEGSLLRLQVIGNHFFYRSIVNGQPVVVDYDLSSGSFQILNVDYPGVTTTYNLRQAGDKLYLFKYGLPVGSELFLIWCKPLGTNKIEGTVWIDDDQDNVLDAGETRLNNQIIRASSPEVFGSTNDTGFYSIPRSDTSGNYQVSLTGSYENWQFSSAPVQSVVQTHEGEITSGVNFGLYPIAQVSDAGVLVGSSAARPGMTVYSGLQVTNHGTTPFSGAVAVSLDSRLSYVSSSLTPDLINGNTLNFFIANLQPFSNAYIGMAATLISTSTPGDTLVIIASVDSTTDANTADNKFVFSKVITASFDPNNKIVEPAGFGSDNVTPAGTSLIYTVNFQNTGTDTAFTVVVRDTIASDLLDMNTFRPLISSSPYELEISGNGNLAFHFNDILLPDSNTNEPGSHGFLQYRIKVKDDAPNGSLVNNTAHIYFDFNVPVATNTTANLIGEPSNVRKVDIQSFTAFPNPASNYLTINSLTGNETISIYDVLGQEVIAGIEVMNNRLNVSGLSPGFYVMEISTTGVTGRSSFVKQ